MERGRLLAPAPPLWSDCGVPLSLTLVTSAVALLLAAGGTPGPDRLTVTNPAGGKLAGGGGPDMLLGGPGPDRLLGESAADTLLGAGGDDRLDGGSGGDRMDGGPGADEIVGDFGSDEID